YRWNSISLIRLYRIRHHHERRWIIRFEEVACRLAEDGRTEGAKRLPILDAAVEDVFHVLAAWVGSYTAVTEGTQRGLPPALKPPDNLSVRQLVNGSGHQFISAQSRRTHSERFQVLLDLQIAILGTVVHVPHHK